MGKTPEEIELELKQARYDLAARIDALTGRAGRATQEVKEKVKQAKRTGVKVAAVGLVAAVGILFIKRALSNRS